MHPTKWILATAMICSFACCKKDDDGKDIGLNDTDRDFMMKASYANYAEIDAGNVAASQGMKAEIKSFGAMMVADHTTAQNELKTVADQTKFSTLPTAPDAAHVAMKNMLMTMSGRAFDSAYMKMQVMDHQNTIALMQTEIANGNDLRVKNYATAKLPIVQHHQHMADSIVMVNGF